MVDLNESINYFYEYVIKKSNFNQALDRKNLSQKFKDLKKNYKLF
jgi:hypothetical protein